MSVKLLTIAAALLAGTTIANAQSPPSGNPGNSTATESQVQVPPTDPQSRREKDSATAQGDANATNQGPVALPKPGVADPKQLPGTGNAPRGG